MTQVVKAPGGRRLSVDSLGDPDGRPVFLLHGTPGSRNGPRPRGIVLHRLGIRLICYDRPGYPGSTGSADAGSRTPQKTSRPSLSSSELTGSAWWAGPEALRTR